MSTKDIQAQRSGSYAQPVPPSESTLSNEDDMRFILAKTCCHRERMNLKDMSLVKAHPRPIHSPVFIIELYRYYACLLVILGGENLSVGLRIMKGRDDKELVWPFNMIVMFRLRNLNGREDLVRMFRCDRNISRLKEAVSRPKTDMNLAIGFPCLVSQQRLDSEGFIRNNKISLECYLFPKDAKIDHRAEYPSIIKT